MTTDVQQIRLVRIIARLNIGGPAIQAITLTKLLQPRGYSTRLIRGRESPSEGNMDYLAEERGVVPTRIERMQRNPGPGDVVALIHLVRILRRDRPHVVHTHAAKAGTLGRTAALLAFPRARQRPVLVHTFHGHSLTGYFSGRTAGVFRTIERLLARSTDQLIAVSPEVRSDLVALGIAPGEKFVVVPLGFDLSPFLDDDGRRGRRDRLRQRWGIGAEETVVTLVARLVPIKRVDRFLSVARELAARERVRFVIVGDGELRDQLVSSRDARELGDRLIWAGFMREIADVCFASDVVMLTSDNEGTPVSLIEAQAAAVPVVATDVGGVRSAVRDGETGVIIGADDAAGLAAAVSRFLDDPQLASRFGAAGRGYAAESFSIETLVNSLDVLYREQLSRTGGIDKDD